jgi:thiol peroxidase
MPLSTFRGSFNRDYGVELVDGPLKGVSARAIVVVDENDKVIHTELVPEIAQEPDYDAAIAAVG